MRKWELLALNWRKGPVRGGPQGTYGGGLCVGGAARGATIGATTITPYHHHALSSRLLEECDTDSSIRCHVRPVLVSLLKSLAEVRRRRGRGGGMSGVHRERGGL